MHLLAPDQPPDLVTNRHHGSWLAGSAFPGAAYFAGGCAILVTLTPWLSRAWRRTLWILLATAAVARLVAGTALPAELVVAAAVGATVGFGLLVAFGAPDRRIGPSGVADALAAGGLSVAGVRAADVEAKGCRPFVATTVDGRRLFVKVFGKDQRQADLLYRAYRYGRLKGVGHSRPAASLIQSVEHQALAEIMAERAGVRVPRVERIAQAADGSAMLAMDFVHGRSLNQVPDEGISEELLSELWRQVDRLHRAGIAHRSLRSGNVMLDTANRTRIVDFSFSELAANERQLSLDVAELLASTAALVGPERAVAGAVSGVGGEEVTRAVPLLQPLALSASTRQAVRGKDGLLTRTRVAAAGVMGAPANELARLQRVRLRTVVMVGLAVGAFYFLLPQLAQARNSWKAFQSANFVWLPLVIAMSALTYVAGNLSIMGTVSRRLPFGPTLLLQSASSFVNRVSPANVGGMALNVRYLQKSGVDSPTAVSAVGLNSFVGGIMHILLIAVFFAWSGAALTKAFKLPSGSKLLLVLAVLAAALGVVLATRWGRRTVLSRLVRGIQRSLANLRQVATSPVKLALLFGGIHPRHARLCRRPGRVHPGLWGRSQPGPDRRGLPGGLGSRRRRSHPWRPRCHRSGPGGRTHRRGHAPGRRGLRRAHLPVGHLLVTRAARMAVLALSAAPAIHMTAVRSRPLVSVRGCFAVSVSGGRTSQRRGVVGDESFGVTFEHRGRPVI